VATRVAFRRTDVPPEIRANRDGWLTHFLDAIAGTITHSITDDKDMFTITPQEDIENQKSSGMIRYHGRLDKGALTNTSEMLLIQKIKNQSKIIQYVATHAEGLEKSLAQISQIKTLDMDEMSQWFQKLSDRIKNIKIITRKGGSEIEEIATQTQ